MDIRAIAQDPEFLKLPPEEQRKAFIEADPDFGSLPESEQLKGMQEILGQKKSGGVSIGNQILRGAEMFAGGANKSIAGLAGMPVDMINTLLKVSPVTNALGLSSEKPVGGSEWLKENILPGIPKAQTPAENFVQAAGEQVTNVIPGIGMAARTGAVMPAIKEGAKFAGGAAAGSGIARTVAPGSEIADVAGQVAGGLGPSAPGMVKSGVSSLFDNIAQKRVRTGLQEVDKLVPPEMKPVLADTRNQTDALANEIPGWKPNLGQREGDPNLLAITELKKQGYGPGAYQAKVGPAGSMPQNAALRSYVEKRLVGEGKPDAFIATLDKELTNLNKTAETLYGAAEIEGRKVIGRRIEDVGSEMIRKLEKLRSASSQHADALYAKVPDKLEIDSKPLYDEINRLFGSYDEFSKRLSAIPSGPAGRMKTALEPLESEAGLVHPVTGKPLAAETTAPLQVTMKQMKDFRSQMTTIADRAFKAGDYELGRNALQLKKSVNDTLALAVKNGEGEAVQALKNATDYYREVHVPTFREGPVGEVLRNGKEVVNSAVGKEFFFEGKTGVPEAVQNFRMAFKDDLPAATELIRDYAAQDLLSKARNAVTGELDAKMVERWLMSHKDALDAYGIRKDFNSIQAALARADAAKANVVDFQKSSLGKALNVDPDKAIATAFMTGAAKRNSIENLQKMYDLALKEGKPAVEGLRAGIGKYFQKSAGLTPEDITSANSEKLSGAISFMENYFPAISGVPGLYTSKELSAFKSVHDALKLLAASGRPHPGGFGGREGIELAEKAAAGSVSIALGHLGLYGTAKTVFGKLIGTPIWNRVDKILSEAVFDPRYADAIKDFAVNVKTLSPEGAAKQLTRRLSILGDIAVGTSGNGGNKPAVIPPKKEEKSQLDFIGN